MTVQARVDDSLRPAESAVARFAVSREAIYDSRLNVWAYELRYADPRTSGASQVSSDDSTSSVVLDAFAEFGLSRVAGDRKVFLHAGAKTITGEMQLPVEPGRVVFEVRDYEYATTDLAESIIARKQEGFSVALADFVYTDDVDALLSAADYVKLDYTRLGDVGLAEHAELLRNFDTRGIVCGLQESAQVEQCRSLGFESFQGEFLFKPEVLKRKGLPASMIAVSELLTKLQDPDVPFGAIEEIIKRDAGLSLRVLKFLNSSAYGFRQEVSSVTQAVSLLGLEEFMKWALLMMVSARFEKPGELLKTALVRAKTCENYSRRRQLGTGSSAFMVGLLSVLDAIVDAPMNELLAELPLSPTVCSAILDFEGPLGEVLELVVIREQQLLDLDSQEQERLTSSWLEAVEWAENAYTKVR